MLSGFIPNGLLPNKATSVTKVLDQERWSQVEDRTAELLAIIQPNQDSEERRNAVVSYMQRLIMNCVPCQVFTYGSVPLKTYLPDGDIDLTAFCEKQNLTDSMMPVVLDILRSEEKKENAEFHVKEVQCIRAEVKIIKCLVDNFVVDISFNQIGGLCTLCFLEEVDFLIGQNHLFKRSIILIKAWCYYESRILGSHHGLISTYALETLVLYIFHVYSNTFAGPLEVLYRFLDFFSKFDWENYCISLLGLVPKGSLPNMKAEPPRKDCQELLLSEWFLDACMSCYGVMPNSQENQEQPFVSKHVNIIDPLRGNNNLGRSISKASFFRIKSAIAFGAQRLVRLLDCPEDHLMAEFDFFFKNTWSRHGNGYWMDARTYNLYVRNENDEKSTFHESEIEQAQASHGSDGIYQKPANYLKESKRMFGTSDASVASQTWSSKTNGIFTGTMTSDIQRTSSVKTALADKDQSLRYSSNEVHAMHNSGGACSSPELARSHGEVPSQHRYPGASERESGQIHPVSSTTDNSRISGSRSEVSDNHNTRVSSENQQSFGKLSYDWRSEDAVESHNASNSYYCEFGTGVNNENSHSVDDAKRMHQEEHDFMNLSETYWNLNFDGYLQEPVNVNSSNISVPPPPHDLASGYGHENSFGALHGNDPSFESFSGNNMSYSEDLVPFPALQWFPTTLNQEEISEPVDYNMLVGHLDHERQMAANSGSSYSDSSWHTSPGSHSLKEYVETTEQKCLTRENDSGNPPDVRIISSDVNSAACSIYTCAPHSTSRTNFSSSSSSNESPSITGTTYLDAELGNLRIGESIVNLGSTDKSKHSDAFHVDNINHDTISECFAQQRSDILNGDFESYWLNLQYGRFCQTAQSEGSLPDPPSAVPPMFLRGQYPWHRKLPGFMNIMGPDAPLVPEVSNQCVSGLHVDDNQCFAFWLPRLSAGTGTYLPNPIAYYQRFRRRDEHSKNQDGNNKNERKDNHGERERNRNHNSRNNNSKERFPSRFQYYRRVEKPGTDETSHQGECSNSASNKEANPEKDPKDSSPQQPSSSNSPEVTQDDTVNQ